MKKTVDFIFSYGDSVQISSNAPTKYHPEKRGEICGMRRASDRKENLYLVEFGDGSDKEIPEQFLQLITHDLPFA